MAEQQFRTFAEYVAAMKPKAKENYPEPEAMTARRLVSGWRVWCQKHDRSPDFPPEVSPSIAATEEAKGWYAKAWEAAKLAKDYGGSASSFEVVDLATAFLAMHGRGPHGRKFVSEVAR